MSKAIITSRSLKNTETGIDISVPEFRTFSKLLTTQEEFHVIIISRLAFFKTEAHKDDDVVQFMVPKLYSDFEALHRAMSERYPATIFPDLPKKILMVRDSTPQQRRGAFDRLMQFIAASPKVCTAPLLLEFLGVSRARISAVDGGKQTEADEGDAVVGSNGSTPSPEESPAKSVKSQSSSLFGEEDSDDELFKTCTEEAEEEEPDGDLFSPVSKQSALPASADGDDLIVNADVRTVSKTELQDALFVPFEGSSSEVTSSDILGLAEEDNSDLLNVEDDLEKLLTMTAKPKTSPNTASASSREAPAKPLVKPRPPTKPRMAGTSAAAAPTSKPEPSQRAVDRSADGTELMAEDDIMRYIQENAAVDEAGLDLF